MMTNILSNLLAVVASLAAGGNSLEEATRAFQAGEYPKVIELAGSAAATEADWPRLQYLAGEAQLVLGGAAEAEQAFRGVLAMKPAAVPAQVGLGRALTAQGKLDEAEKTLAGALAAEPRDVGALVAHGIVLSLTGKADAARKELEAAAKLDPKSALVARGHVEVLLRADDVPGAATAVEAFVQARPEHPMGPFLMGWVQERDGEDELAIEQYRAALELDPAFLDAHKNLAILCHTLSNTYRDKQRVELAFEHYGRYFALGGKDPELRSMYDSLLGFKEQILGM